MYSFVLIIQCNAFLMTLRRKNLVPHGVAVTIYGVGLAVGNAIALAEYYREGKMDSIRVVMLLSCVSGLWRMGPGSNSKYLIWTTMGVLLQWVLRPSIAHDTPLTKQQVRRIADLSLVLAVTYGIYKGLCDNDLHQRLERKLDVERK
jgi:hypothetical protein